MAVVSAGRDGNLAVMDALVADPLPSAGRFDFADLEVVGDRLEPSPWSGLRELPDHWITPCQEVDPQAYQGFPGLIRGKSGELTVSVPFQHPCGGRTWSQPEPAPLEGGLASFVRDDGTWVRVNVRAQGTPQDAFHSYESSDEGRTWAGPKPLELRGDWPEEFTLPCYSSGQALSLRDGSHLLPFYCSVEMPSMKVDTVFVFRSTDDGHTWQAPVRCDRNNLPAKHSWFSAGDFNEVGLAETEDNVVIGYGRPRQSPFMWQVRSNDGGRSWEPAAYGPFPGYCSTVTATASGALVAVHRFPYLAANVSFDGGASWDAGTILDWAHWANQKALEAEPNVVLISYMGMYEEPGQQDIRVARLRVTDSGLTLDH